MRKWKVETVRANGYCGAKKGRDVLKLRGEGAERWEEPSDVAASLLRATLLLRQAETQAVRIRGVEPVCSNCNCSARRRRDVARVSEEMSGRVMNAVTWAARRWKQRLSCNEQEHKESGDEELRLL